MYGTPIPFTVSNKPIQLSPLKVVTKTDSFGLTLNTIDISELKINVHRESYRTWEDPMTEH